jgi:glucose/arabinose dehydrogenase
MNTGLLCSAAIAVILSMPYQASAQQGDGTEVQITTNVFKPNKLPPTSDRIGQLKLPDGFKVEPFAQGLGNSRIIAVSDQGFVYVSRREEGDVLLLKDEDGDGKADKPPAQVVSRAQAHGLAIKDNKLYLVTVKEVFVADIKQDGTLGALEMIIGDLPDSGQHPNRVMAFGPDGMLYISVGSTCNACNEAMPKTLRFCAQRPTVKAVRSLHPGCETRSASTGTVKPANSGGSTMGSISSATRCSPKSLTSWNRASSTAGPMFTAKAISIPNLHQSAV